MKKEERDRMARAMARPAVVVGRAAAPVPGPEPVKIKVYAAEKVRCAYCGNTNSRVTKTIGNIRYRRCMGGCGRNFIEKGVSLKLKEDR